MSIAPKDTVDPLAESKEGSGRGRSARLRGREEELLAVFGEVANPSMRWDARAAGV